MAVISDRQELTPQNALIFRLTHIDNVAWILDNGLHCKASNVGDPNFVAIGNPDLIQKRTTRRVSAGAGGTLDTYVPFYFTPWSMMLYNLRTGWDGMTRRTPQELVFFVVSLRSLAEHGVPFVFSDRHAFINLATFSTSLDNLKGLPWKLWQNRDFSRNPNDPEKAERYQAEALVHRHLPSREDRRHRCSGDPERTRVEAMVDNCGGQVEVICRRDWFF